MAYSIDTTLLFRLDKYLGIYIFFCCKIYFSVLPVLVTVSIANSYLEVFKKVLHDFLIESVRHK